MVWHWDSKVQAICSHYLKILDPKKRNSQEWDDELAAVAQRHADQCVFDHDCAKCRSPAPHLYLFEKYFVALKWLSESFGLCHGLKTFFLVDLVQVSFYFRSVDRWGVGQNLYIYKQVLVKIFAKQISHYFWHIFCASTNRCSTCFWLASWSVVLKAQFSDCMPFTEFFQSLRLPPTNWKRAVTDWYDEVRNAHVSIKCEACTSI